MGQTRVKAGHIELVQGSKYTKNVKQMVWIGARDKKRSNRSKSIFFPSGSFVFLESSISFVFIAYFQAKKIIVNSL